MHLLSAYRDDDDDDDASAASASAPATASASSSSSAASSSYSFAPKRVLNAAPGVEMDVRVESLVDPATKLLYHNPTADQLWQAPVGPFDPSNRDAMKRNTVAGYIEPTAISEHAFNENFHTFQTYGYAVNPSDDVSGGHGRGRAVVLSNNTFASAPSLSTTSSAATASNASASASASSSSSSASASASGSGSGARDTKTAGGAGAAAAEGTAPVVHRTKVSHALVSAVNAASASSSHDLAELPSVYSTTGRASRKAVLDAAGNERKRTKNAKEDYDPANVDGYKGSWSARFEDELPQAAAELTDEQKAYIASLDEKKSKEKRDGGGPAFEESTQFHGKEERDYQGRSYLHPPGDQKAVSADYKSFIPKKWIHTWSGHSKGVQRIEWFPKTGHLLLSGSMDHTVKLWDAYGTRKCLRTFLGHDEAVRDLTFTNDGTKFLSASYDKYVKLWDTETGQVISRHTTKKIPYCVRFHPDKQDEFLVGQSNKKIVQWDTRSTETVQSYDEHLGPVNTVTFVDGGRRFVSSADDKKVFIWEYGIPVVIKHISEPDMHSMPFIALHPNGKFFCGQSQDNQILVYSAINRFKVNKKKHFVGHKNAGFAAQIAFSPDGKFVISGDAEGRCFFWDWQTSRCYKKLKCHDQVTIGATWHPVEPSWVATCSWDGTIKLWD